MEWKNIKGDYFILATGGKSYPQTGSSGEGYNMAESVGHTVTEINPALVPIEVQEEWIRDLQGLSLKNCYTWHNRLQIKKLLYSEFGEMLFTHFGISGPIVLSSSRVISKFEELWVLIDLKPALSNDELDKRIQNDFNKYCNKDFKNFFRWPFTEKDYTNCHI